MATPATGPVRLSDGVRLAVGTAFTVGLIEAAVVAFQQHVLGAIVYRSRHYIWMAPVGALSVFVPALLLLWLLARRWPVLMTRRVVGGTLVFLASLSLLLLAGWLHAAAALLLAAGLALRLSRPAAERWPLALRVVRPLLPATAAAVALLAGAAFAAPVWREARALEALPDAPGGAPNVLLIFLDTVRAESLSLLGYGRETTPQLTRLAARGVSFDRAIAPAPWTLPSHASVFTGHPAHELSAGFFVPLDDTRPTLAQAMAAHGYATAGFVANYFNADYEHGVARGFHHWEDYRLTPGQVLYNSILPRRLLLDGSQGRQASRLLQILDLDMRIGEKRAEAVTSHAVEWLSKDRARPSFVFLNYFDAHYPYDPPSPYDSMFGGPDTVTRPVSARLKRALSLARWRGESQAAEAELRNLYEEEIAELDAQIGALLDELEARGILEHTLVIVTSDHGEEFGEHGRYEHGSNVFLTQLHVPLVLSLPSRIPSGVRVSAPVGLRHLAATIGEITGATEAASLGGRSLAPLWNGADGMPTAPVLSVLEKRGEFHASLVTPRLHYIFANGVEHLFDHVADGSERNDLVHEPWAADTLAWLRRTLAERLADKAPSELLGPQN